MALYFVVISWDPFMRHAVILVSVSCMADVPGLQIVECDANKESGEKVRRKREPSSPTPPPRCFAAHFYLPVPTIWKSRTGYVWRVKTKEQLSKEEKYETENWSFSKEVLLLLLISCMGDKPRISCLADFYSFFLFFLLLAGFLWRETCKRKHI